MRFHKGIPFRSGRARIPLSRAKQMPISTAVPRILLANPDEIFARSLESILSSAGYAVLWAPTALSALEHGRARPDAAIIAMELADEGGGLALCRALRRERGPSPRAPIFLPPPNAATRPQRIAALPPRADELGGHPRGPAGVCPPPAAHLPA